MADKNDILLEEYQACQSHTNNLGLQAWTSYGVIFSVNTALLAAFAYQVISKWWSLKLGIALLILGFGAVMTIFFEFFLKPWRERIMYLIYVNHVRMRKIEDEVQINGDIIMEKNWLIRGLDLLAENKPLCEAMKRRKDLINSIRTRYIWFPDYKPPTHTRFTARMRWAIAIPWVLLFIAALILSLI